MRDEQNFIGHDKEQQLFKEWIDARQAESPWIMFFHDATSDPAQQGGVGKTWLLRKCAQFVQQNYPEISIVMIDFFSVIDRDGVEIARRIVESFQIVHPQWNPASFRQTLNEYYMALSRHADLADIHARLYGALVHDLQVLDQDLMKQHKRLLVFFDTYELIEKHPVVAVFGSVQTFPDTYHMANMRVVIAGRNAPDWQHSNWRGREQEVQCVPIEPFSLGETVQFINENSITLQQPLLVYSEQAQELYSRTRGRPILVGLVTDFLNHAILTLEELTATRPRNFENYLVSQINRLDNPVNWVVLFMAHIYHRFTPELLHWLLTYSVGVNDQVKEVEPQALFEKLAKLSFVRRSSTHDEIALHDEMRRLVNTHNWPEQEFQTGVYRRDLSLGAIGYNENENKKQVTSERMRQTNIVELVYHKLFVDINEGFRFFEEHFKQAISMWQHAFARSLLQEAQKFQHQFSDEQRYRFLLEGAVLLAREDSYYEALVSFQKLEELIQITSEDWLTPERKNEVFFEKGRCCLQLNLFDDALACFHQSLVFDKLRSNDIRVAFTLSQLGHIYRRQGELERAAEYYQQSVALYKKHGSRKGFADALYGISMLTRLQGRFEEALRQSLITLHIRQQLFEQSASGEVPIAFSLSGIGTIYLKIGDSNQAQKYFEDAYEIYVRNKYRIGIATIFTRFGQVAMEKNALDIAMEWYQKAHQESLGVNTDAEINSLNKQGRVLMMLNQFQEAIPYLERAIDRAGEVRDFYQQAESLVDLATVHQRLGQYDIARKALRQAEGITTKYHYYYLLGQAENLRGDDWYKDGKYEKAFEYFSVYCYNMFLYNEAEYERAVRKIINALLSLSLPRQQRHDIQEQIRDYWLSLQLQEKSSPMLNMLGDVEMLMDI